MAHLQSLIFFWYSYPQQWQWQQQQHVALCYNWQVVVMGVRYWKCHPEQNTVIHNYTDSCTIATKVITITCALCRHTIHTQDIPHTRTHARTQSKAIGYHTSMVTPTQ